MKDVNFNEHEVHAEIESIVAERRTELKRRLADERQVVTITRQPRFMKLMMNRIATAVITAFTIGAGMIYVVFDLPPFGMLAIGGLPLGMALLVTVFREVIGGAGMNVHKEYVHHGIFSRTYEFEPSIRNIWQLLGLLLEAFVAIVVGFAAVFGALSTDKRHFATTLDGVAAAYFSLVTFATVGYGDIAPRSAAARAIVVVEIAISFFAVAIVLATTLAWVVARQQREHDNFMESRRARVQRTEELLRDLKLGNYSDPQELRNEALVRLSRKRERDGLTRIIHQHSQTPGERGSQPLGRGFLQRRDASERVGLWKCPANPNNCICTSIALPIRR